MIAKNELLKKYNISEDEFEVADIKWEELEYIYKDFSEKRSSYEQKLAEFQKEFLMNISENGIHSIRTRVKDAEHLIVKIIRKRQENYKKYRTLDKDNYEKFLTDVIGIRCFILFKADWKKFHAYLEEKIEDNPQYYLDDCLKDFDEDTEHTYMAEMPKVHIRDGDAREIYETVLPPDAIKNKKIYRSVHYIVKYHGVYIEIQVRTLFEEGWGEIDHHIVYPYYQDDMLFQQYTSLLNRLTGLADEMSSFFCEVKRLEEEHLQRVKTEPDGNESQKIVDEEDEISKACPVEEKEPLLDDNTAAACIQNVLYE